MSMINPDTGVPLFRQLADIIRGEIERGELKPGQRLRAEPDYEDEYDVSRTTVRQAMAALRSEGLITTTRRGSRVRTQRNVAEVVIGTETRVTTRMPTDAERRQLGIAEGVPVFEVKREGQEPEILPGDRTALIGE